jgi:hypothetical protein
MKRRLLISLMFVTGPALAEELPVPPIPPDHPPIGDTAPVPDVDARAPVPPSSEQTSINVKLYRSDPPDTSLGFLPGSRFRNSEERKPIQTPGFSITVPLR